MDTTNNPIEILYCWQALVMAVAIYMLTHTIKAAIPHLYTPKTEKGKVILKRVVMPAVPPLLGFIGSIIVPLHPEVLSAYVTEHVKNAFQGAMIYGIWGAAVGQFADYAYTKVTKLLGAIASQSGTEESNQ